MHITNGKVSFTRSVRPADFENKAATVEFSFALNEDDDVAAVTEQIARTATERALQMVGLQARPAGQAGGANIGVVGANGTGNKEAAAANLNTADATKPKTPARAPKASKPPADTPAAVENKTDPAQVTDDDALLGGAETRPDITDTDIAKALTHRNGELVKEQGQSGTVKLRDLIKEFVGPPPKGSRDIPQARRQEFLDRLKETK